MDADFTSGEGALTERQREVLEATLQLIVEAPETLTMTAVAKRASCSKETLYKWFGGRDGLLTATVQWQAGKVRASPLEPVGLDLIALRAALCGFATDWLTVISSETSVALNRVAIGQASGERQDLGTIVLENGPLAMRRRLGRMLEMGRDAGLLAFDDLDEAFGTFFGLVVRDVQIRLLLGERTGDREPTLAADARHAVEQFFVLFGTSEKAA